MELHGGDKRYEVEANGKVLGSVKYNKSTGALAGDVACTRGGRVRFRAAAVDRNLNNVTLIPLDVATPVKPAAGAKPTATAKPALTTPSGLPPAGERFTATRQRESFGHQVAAFFIAVAIVMLVARLFGLIAIRLGQPPVMGEVLAGIMLGPTLLGGVAPELRPRCSRRTSCPPSGTRPTSG